MRTLASLKEMTLFQFRNLMRNKIAFFVNLILPIGFLVLFGSMYGNENSFTKVPIGVVDQDGGTVSQFVRKALETSYDVVTGEEAALRERLAKDNLKAVVVIPEGASRQVTEQHRTATISVVQNPTSQGSKAAVAGLQQLINYLDLTPQTAPPPLVATVSFTQDTYFDFFDFMMPGMLVYMLLNAGVITVSIAVATQAGSGSMRHMFSTPLSMGVWMTARILANLMLAVVQIVIIFLAARLLFGVLPPQDLLGTAVLLVLSTLASLGIGVAIGSVLHSWEAAMGVSMVVSFAMTFLGNVMIPLDGAPKVIQTIAAFLPSSHMTKALRMVMMQGQGLGSVLPEIAVMAGSAAVCVAFATWRIRRYGAAT